MCSSDLLAMSHRAQPTAPCRPAARPEGASRQRLIGLVSALLPLLLGLAPPAHAGVHFENCVTGSDGSIRCDTVPTGNTLADDEAARYGLFSNASPGWNEFDPFAGYADEFGGNQS